VPTEARLVGPWCVNNCVNRTGTKGNPSRLLGVALVTLLRGYTLVAAAATEHPRVGSYFAPGHF